MPSATVQTAVRQPLLMAGAPATTIAIAGSQYSVKTSHRLDRMSRDSQVVASDFILRTDTSIRSRQFYNLERRPESSGIAVQSRATRKLSLQSLGQGIELQSCRPPSPESSASSAMGCVGYNLRARMTLAVLV